MIDKKSISDGLSIGNNLLYVNKKDRKIFNVTLKTQSVIYVRSKGFFPLSKVVLRQAFTVRLVQWS